jgi:hypothetical protein
LIRAVFLNKAAKYNVLLLFCSDFTKEAVHKQVVNTDDYVVIKYDMKLYFAPL